MKRLWLLCAAVIAALAPLHAQGVETEFDALRMGEMARYEAHATYLRKASAIQRVIDVKYYKLVVRVADEKNVLSGEVTAVSIVTDPSINVIEYDLNSTMAVDSAFVNGVPSVVTPTSATIRLATPKTFHAGDTVTTRVTYHGSPAYTGLGSYSDVTSRDGTRWIYTLSEPYGARDWWPCIDQPGDKADSADIWITCNQNLTAATNGKLVGTIQNADGTKTFKWKHRYPISTYLIPISVGNFTEFSFWYKYSPTDSMEIMNYVLPGIETKSPDYRANTGLTPKMIGIYASLFGQYPFIREKYGHIEFGWGGGMEHQTLTSLGSSAFYETTIAHELAHQWFGDMITCRTWPDLWLNEGFAQYFESVYREKAYGTNAYFTSILSRLSDAKKAVGTLYVQDTANVNNLFASSRVYNKGSWVLHMLRHAVGDSLFFASIRAYANTSSLMYSTASTADLRAAFERTTGRDLGWFFSEWVYGERYPVYSCAYSAERSGASFFSRVQIKQSTGTANPSFFTMPIDLKFTVAGWDTTVTVWNDTPDQMFTIPLSRVPQALAFDPDRWLLCDVTTRLVANAEIESAAPASYFLTQNYPNPFNPSTVIRFGLEAASHVTIRIYDMMGRDVATVFEGEKAPGVYSVPVNAAALSSGAYVYRMTAQHGATVYTATKRLVIIR